MADTLGSLCDKLTIVRLKQFHSEDRERLNNLEKQNKQLREEIDAYMSDALTGRIPAEKLTFSANKVYKKEGNALNEVEGSLGQMISQLAEVNCKLWHVQEHVYDFEKVPVAEKDAVVKQLALLNLERNRCIDGIDRQFQTHVVGKRSGSSAS